MVLGDYITQCLYYPGNPAKSEDSIGPIVVETTYNSHKAHGLMQLHLLVTLEELR